MKPSTLLAAVIAMCCTNFAHAAGPTTLPTAEGPVIVKMVSRDQTVTVRAGKNGPTYSVEGADGKILLASATLEQLRAQEPDLAKFIETMQASAWAGVDAN